VLERACQERIFDAVRCVRGTDGQLPEIRVLTEDELREESALEAANEADAGSDGADADTGPEQQPEPDEQDTGAPSELEDAGAEDSEPGDADPRLDRAQRWKLALSLFGLVTPESSQDAFDDIAGSYRSDLGVTLVDRGQPQDSAGSQTTLAHEFVHALQDQQIGLRELRRSAGQASDAWFAGSCLIEGEASLYEELAWVLLQELSVDREYWDKYFRRRLKYARDAVVSADSPYERVWRLSYAVGASYLADAWFEGGNWAVQSMYERPPISTAHWMHGLSGLSLIA
jgi:hypothetical protein